MILATKTPYPGLINPLPVPAETEIITKTSQKLEKMRKFFKSCKIRANPDPKYPRPDYTLPDLRIRSSLKQFEPFQRGNSSPHNPGYSMISSCSCFRRSSDGVRVQWSASHEVTSQDRATHSWPPRMGGSPIARFDLEEQVSYQISQKHIKILSSDVSRHKNTVSRIDKPPTSTNRDPNHNQNILET